MTRNNSKIAFLRISIAVITYCLSGFVADTQARSGSSRANVTARMNVFRDRIYAPQRTSLNALDIYSPVKANRHPVVIYIHGGSYIKGSKSIDVFHKPEFFTSNGVVFVSVDYRLSPKVRYPCHVADVADSIAWVYKNIDKYSGDRSSIYLLGHSAGAQLVALVALDQRFLIAKNVPLRSIKGVVLLDGGTYNLPLTWRSSANKTMMLSAFGNDPKIWWEASPLAHISRNKLMAPFLIFAISPELSGYTQAKALSDALTRAGAKSSLVLARGKDHASLNEDFGLPDDKPAQRTFSFLKLHQSEQ